MTDRSSRRPYLTGQTPGHPHGSFRPFPLSRAPAPRGHLFGRSSVPSVSGGQDKSAPRNAFINSHRYAPLVPGQKYTFGEPERKTNMQCTMLEEQLKKDLGLSSGGNSESTPEFKDVQGECLSNVGFDCLWCMFVNSKGNKLKDVLTEIFTRVTREEHIDVGLMKPETFQTFSRIIGE